MNWDGRIRADARHLPIAGKSISLVVTSPPFWQLRKYDIPDSIWGGDPACVHDWSASVEVSDVQMETISGKTRTSKAFYLAPSRTFNGNHQKHSVCQFCQFCQAWKGQLGTEPTPQLFIEHCVMVFREVKRVLKDDGNLFVEIGDSYANGTNDPKSSRRDRAEINITNRRPPAGLKPKDLVGIPWMLAFALRDDGWYLREEIIWHKPNVLPESVKDRCTRAHSTVFHFTKSLKYYFDHKAIQEKASADSHARYARGRSDNHKYADGGPGNQSIAKSFEYMATRNGVHPKSAPSGSGIRSNDSFSAAVKDIVDMRNKRSVWSIPTEPFKGHHFATMPQALVEPCILAGCRDGDIVCDIFSGSGTVTRVAERHNRRWIGIDLGYQDLQEKRLRNVQKELLNV